MDSGLVRTENTHNSTRYIITPAGKETLHFFHDKISPSIEEDIAAYFQANKLAIKTENAYLSDYTKHRNRNTVCDASSGKKAVPALILL